MMHSHTAGKRDLAHERQTARGPSRPWKCSSEACHHHSPFRQSTAHTWADPASRSARPTPRLIAGTRKFLLLPVSTWTRSLQFPVCGHAISRQLACPDAGAISRDPGILSLVSLRTVRESAEAERSAPAARGQLTVLVTACSCSELARSGQFHGQARPLALVAALGAGTARPVQSQGLQNPWLQLRIRTGRRGLDVRVPELPSIARARAHIPAAS